MPPLPEVPTAMEEGFKIETSNMHFWWMPKGTPTGVQAKMGEVIAKAMASEAMKNFMETSWIDPVTLKSQDLSGELIEREHVISKVAIRKVDVLPSFELWVFAIVGVLSFFAFDKTILEKKYDIIKKNIVPIIKNDNNVQGGGDLINVQRSADPLWVRACRCFSPIIKGLIN